LSLSGGFDPSIQLFGKIGGLPDGDEPWSDVGLCTIDPEIARLL
jgi:hypothetical protein